ncbi:MAG: hypothetical protein EWM73_03410 [Nitrospira sp.]|nr:MAG: hypothetical protein EWM73_03410 [Nitrospira sp.]
MAFLTIIEDDETFEYSPTDPTTGERLESVFIVRILPHELLKTLRRAHTKRVFENHQQVDRVDDIALGQAIIDYSLVNWRGIKSGRTDEDLPCTADLKTKLPEVVKADIIRVCAGKESAEVARTDQEKKLLKPILNLKATNFGT